MFELVSYTQMFEVPKFSDTSQMRKKFSSRNIFENQKKVNVVLIIICSPQNHSVVDQEDATLIF